MYIYIYIYIYIVYMRLSVCCVYRCMSSTWVYVCVVFTDACIYSLHAFMCVLSLQVCVCCLHGFICVLYVQVCVPVYVVHTGFFVYLCTGAYMLSIELHACVLYTGLGRCAIACKIYFVQVFILYKPDPSQECIPPRE